MKCADMEALFRRNKALFALKNICALLVALACFSWAVSVLAEPDGIPQVKLNGVETPDLRNLLEGLSPALWQNKNAPASEAALRGPARRHQERLRKALQSEGYYSAAVDFTVSWSESAPEAVFNIVPGPLYHLEEINVRVWRDAAEQGQPEEILPAALETGLQSGSPARSVPLLDAEQRIVRQLTGMGYPYARAVDREAEVDHDKAAMYITYLLESGERLSFGTPRISGLEKVRLETVQREIVWTEGGWFDQELLEKTRDKLQESGLFTLVRVNPAPPDAVEDGRIPIDMEFNERRHRTISLGLQYRTDEGVGVAADWEHRNFMKLGRSLRLRSQVTELEQNFSVNYDIPEFMGSRDTLTLQAKTAQIETDFYQSRRMDIGAWLEHPFSPERSLGFGPALRASRVKETSRAQNYYLFSFPFQFSLDHRNDRMDPTRGYRFTDRLTPFMDVHDTGVWFVKNELTLAAFFPLGEESGYTLAARLHLGMAGGASLSKIPADERFYAGGGGSIRGYAYQDVGPLDKNGDPIGGRSVTDWSLELRKRLNEQFGLVVFVDGGAAHESPYFDFKDTVQWGAGIGIRYFTPIGPMRFDVAVPLNRREDIDNAVQFYISIGQAF